MITLLLAGTIVDVIVLSLVDRITSRRGILECDIKNTIFCNIFFLLGDTLRAGVVAATNFFNYFYL